jgi:hypothetical protein
MNFKEGDKVICINGCSNTVVFKNVLFENDVYTVVSTNNYMGLIILEETGPDRWDPIRFKPYHYRNEKLNRIL